MRKLKANLSIVLTLCVILSTVPVVFAAGLSFSCKTTVADTNKEYEIATGSKRVVYEFSNTDGFGLTGIGDYLLFECDFMPIENVGKIYLATYESGSAQYGVSIKSGWETNQWNRFSIVYNTDGTVHSVKINGKDVQPATVVDKNIYELVKNNNKGRVVFDHGTETVKVAVNKNTVKIERSATGDISSYAVPTLVGAKDGKLIANTAIATVNSKNSDKTIRVYSDEYNTAKTSGNLAATDKVVVEKDGVVGYYTVEASAVCSDASNVNSKSIYDFQDFTTGPVAEAYMGMQYEFDRNSGEMEICQEGENKYLRVKKSTADKALTWRKDFSKVNDKWIDYVVEFKFRIGDDCVENSSFVIKEQNDGVNVNNGSLYVTLFDNGSIQYKDRYESSTAIYETVENKYTKGEFVTFKAILHRTASGAATAGTGADLYINDELIKANMPCVEGSGFKKLYIIPNKAVTGGIDIDDLKMYNLKDSFTPKTIRVENSVITGYKGCTADNFKDIAITLDEGAEIEFFDGDVAVAGSTVLAKGMTAKVTAADGSYKTYTLGNAESVFTVSHTFNNYSTADRFGIGKVRVTLNVDVAEPERSVSLIIAQKSSVHNCLIQVATDTCTLTQDGEVSAELTTTVAEGTYIEVFVMDSLTNIKPLVATTKKLLPYSDSDAANIEAYFFPGYKTKAVTMSWDDGNHDADTALIEALGDIPATFNLVGSWVKEEYISKYISDGSEIANHSYSHKDLRDNGSANRNDTGVMTEDDVINNEIKQGTEVLNGFLDSSNKIAGFVWPYSEANRTNVKAYLANNDDYDYVYVRDSNVTHRYNLPKDFYDWEFTAIEKDAATYYPGFINDPTTELQLFSVWGHPTFLYNEKDSGGNDYMSIAEFKTATIDPILADSDKLWIAVNKDVAKYIKAIDKTNGNITVDGRTVTNNSNMDVYLRINGKNVIIDANGGTYTVTQ